MAILVSQNYINTFINLLMELKYLSFQNLASKFKSNKKKQKITHYILHITMIVLRQISEQMNKKLFAGAPLATD